LLDLCSEDVNMQRVFMIGNFCNVRNLRHSPIHEAICPLKWFEYEKKGDTGKENECLPKRRMDLLG